MNKSVIRSLHQCAAIPALMVAGIGTAQAQDATADAEQTTEASAQDGLGDIIVTAQRRSESLQDVPISITAFGTETLQTRGITSVSDLARVVHGVFPLPPGLCGRCMVTPCAPPAPADSPWPRRLTASAPGPRIGAQPAP